MDSMAGRACRTERQFVVDRNHTDPRSHPYQSYARARYSPRSAIGIFRKRTVFHMVDESLIQDTVKAGSLRKATIRRLIEQIASAEEAGADAVLVTCSSIGPGVTLAQQLFDIPVLRIDDAMAENAVRQAHTIGVLATLRTTLDPTTALLREKAAEAGRKVELVECLCEDAFPAVLAGDTATHDRMLPQALVEDLKGVDLIVLAQASMARVVDHARGRRGACAGALQPRTRGAAARARRWHCLQAGKGRRLKQRHKVLGLLGLLSVLTFLDRLAIAVAGPAIQSDLHIQPQNWGWILSAYVLANGIFEVPSGAMGDRRGQRGEMTRIVTWWSASTRLLRGRADSGSSALRGFSSDWARPARIPTSAGVIARWFPARERARCQGMVWAASRLGGALAPVLIVPHGALLRLARGLPRAGVGRAFAGRRSGGTRFRNRPQDDPTVTAAELAEIGETRAAHGHEAVPWRRLFRSRALWLIVLAYGCYGCGSWFYFSWFPTWMMHAAGFSLNGVLFASLPFLVGWQRTLLEGNWATG